MRSRLAAVVVAVALMAVAMPVWAGQPWFSVQPGIKVLDIQADTDSSGDFGARGTVQNTTSKVEMLAVGLGFYDADNHMLASITAVVTVPAGGTEDFQTNYVSSDKVRGFDHLGLIVGDVDYMNNPNPPTYTTNNTI